MNVQKKQDVECTLFQTAFNTSSYELTTLGRYFDAVKNGVYKKEVETARACALAGDKVKADVCKKRLPLLVAAGRMEGGRRLKHLVGYSGCVVIDLDDVPGSPLGYLRQAEKLRYVKGGHVSPLGAGLKLFVLVDSDLAHHAQAFAVVSRLIEADLAGVVVDPSGKDANRGCFASYDPQAFYKEAAEVVNIPVAPSEAAVSEGPRAYALANYITKFESSNPFTPGSRHSYLVKLASALNSAGFDLAEVAAECLRRYAVSGFGKQEIEATVADVYHRYQPAHGSNIYRPQPFYTGSGSLKSVKNTTPVSGNADSADESPMGPDFEPVEADLPHFRKDLLNALPTLLVDSLKPAADDTEYDLMLLAFLTMTATALPRVSGLLKGEIYYPPFYTLVIGPSGSGKGCINQLHKLIDPWQRSVFDDSNREVEAYKKKQEAYDLYKQQQRQSKGKAPVGVAPDEPVVVRQKQLHVSGYTTTARLIEQLEINSPYASLLYETELESVNNTLAQDFGGYGYILNQAFQHERVSCSSKTNGSFFIERPQLGFLATGTPGMLAQLVPSTESGLYSRLLLYRLSGNASYRELTAADNVFESAFYFDRLGLRMLELAQFLAGSPTFVSFTDRQRKKLDRYFKREYYNVRVFGNDDVTSVVLRHRLIIFRIAMVFTALRKAENRRDEQEVDILDADFDMAFHIGTTCLRHSLLVSTTLKHSTAETPFKVPTAQRDLFAAMPDRFTTAEILAEARVRGISRSSVFRMLKKAQDYELLISLGGGCYQKTELGKNVTASEMG